MCPGPHQADSILRRGPQSGQSHMPRSVLPHGPLPWFPTCSSSSSTRPAASAASATSCRTRFCSSSVLEWIKDQGIVPRNPYLRRSMHFRSQRLAQLGSVAREGATEVGSPPGGRIGRSWGPRRGSRPEIPGCSEGKRGRGLDEGRVCGRQGTEERQREGGLGAKRGFEVWTYDSTSTTRTTQRA